MENIGRRSDELIRRSGRRKLEYMFSGASVFRLSCAMSAFTVFVFLKALVSMFGVVKLRELQSVYYMAGYSSLEIGIINLFFVGAGAVIMGFITAGLFAAMNEVKKDRTENALKYIKAVRISLIVAVCFTAAVIFFSFSSVRTLDYYYSVVSKFHEGIENNSKDLFIHTIFFGITAVMSEIILIKFMSGMKLLAEGREQRKNINFFEITAAAMCSFQVIYSAWETFFEILHFDYGKAAEIPASLAMLVLSFLILVSAELIVIFLAEAVIDDNFYYSIEDEFEEFFEDERIFESRVFDDKPVFQGKTDGYKLTFEIPHTEYPTNSESDGEKDG